MGKNILRKLVGGAAIATMVFGFVVAGIEQRVAVGGGVPESLGQIRKGDAATFTYTVRNLTPFTMQ